MVDSTVQEGSPGSRRVHLHLHLLYRRVFYKGPPAILVIRHLAVVLSVGISSWPLFIERGH